MTTEYDGHDVRNDFDHDVPDAIPESGLPNGWTPFDTDAGEAKGREAYLFANGHQVLITGGGDEWFVLAYPEHGMADLCGFVRPLLSDQHPEHADLPTASTLSDARAFAVGYMASVRYYEADSTDADLFERV